MMCVIAMKTMVLDHSHSKDFVRPFWYYSKKDNRTE